MLLQSDGKDLRKLLLMKAAAVLDGVGRSTDYSLSYGPFTRNVTVLLFNIVEQDAAV